VARSLVAQATCRCPERRDNPPAREGISGRRTRLIFTEGAGSDLSTKALSHARKRGDVGLGATGMPEARLDRSARNDNTARQPDRARRSGSSVVKRPIHRPLGRENKLASHGRGASLEETPVTHERGCSSSKQWEAEVGRTYRLIDLPGAPQGKLEEGELARK